MFLSYISIFTYNHTKWITFKGHLLLIVSHPKKDANQVPKEPPVYKQSCPLQIHIKASESHCSQIVVEFKSQSLSLSVVDRVIVYCGRKKQTPPKDQWKNP
jgi:hypothetical protein